MTKTILLFLALAATASPSSAATTKHKAPKRRTHTASSPKAPKYKAPKSKAPKYKAPKSRRSSQQAPTPDRYKEIQQALASKGYLSGEPSGKWDTESGEALKRFQADQSLTPDGKLNSLSLIALGLGPKRLTAQSHTLNLPAEAPKTDVPK